jgi:tetratricopeptide (TPR) repeat protein
MNDNLLENLKRIDDYLEGQMNIEEQRQFEFELETDKDLLLLFQMSKTIDTDMIESGRYIKDSIGLKESLQKAKAAYSLRNANKDLENDAVLKDSLQKVRATYNKTSKSKPAGTFYLNRKTMYKISASIAACTILVVAIYFFSFQTPKAQQLAGNYIQANLMEISQSMSMSQDSLQLGISAYNNKDYKKALHYFQGVGNNNPANRDANEYAGYVFLINNDYESALKNFDQLENLKGKFNKGKFLKALTLMERNKEGDIAQAKRLLQQVVNENAGGKKEAEEWLYKLKSIE